MNWFKRLVLHPFVIAVYPILALLAHNLGAMLPWDALRSILFSLLVASALLLILGFIFRSWVKAGLLVTLFLLLSFSYGHIYVYVENAHLFGLNVGRHRVLAVVWLGILGLGAWWVATRKKGLPAINQALNGVALFLLIFPLFQVIRFDVREAAAARENQTDQAENTAGLDQLAHLQVPQGQTPPDIYYIILDAYGRDDTLKKYMGYDNSAFLDSLEKAGFYVARCSQSNYSKTQLSLSSSLNLNYIDAYGLDEDSVQEQTELNLLILNNAVRKALKGLGYQTVVVESGYSPTEWEDSDVYLAANRGSQKSIRLAGGINPFESLLLRTSAGLLVYEFKPLLPFQVQSFLDTSYSLHRERILYALDMLGEIPRIPGPKFVFMHILAPHEPFVFGPNGEIIGRRTPFTLNNDTEYLNPEDYQSGYRGQVNFLDKRLAPAIRAILANSPTPPVIVLQGDHGPLMRVSSPEARMTILNAYYLPQGGESGPYSTISPVNTFRMIFNRYFSARLPLLDDLSYYYDPKQSKFLLVQNQRLGCQEQAH